MRLTQQALEFSPIRRQCQHSGVPGNFQRLLKKNGIHNINCPHYQHILVNMRHLHVFPSPFHRQNLDPDAFSTARPPTHIPLPPPSMLKVKQHQSLLKPSCESMATGGVKGEAGSEVPVGCSAGLTRVIKTHVAAQRWMQHRIWGALARKQWPLFERLLSNYWCAYFICLTRDNNC